MRAQVGIGAAGCSLATVRVGNVAGALARLVLLHLQVQHLVQLLLHLLWLVRLLGFWLLHLAHFFFGRPQAGEQIQLVFYHGQPFELLHVLKHILPFILGSAMLIRLVFWM